ncbi:TPA: cell wall hydrolase, partial [Streptococcus pyogenes]|nr:glucosaminidase domain-containing protein [Streptococcus pyogenes]
MTFLDNIKQGCLDGWTKYKILPSLTAAQAILESGWGKHA